jgi:Leucine-rich repeat (LRR) protein
MVTLQEQFEKDFPDKNVREININAKYLKTDFTNYDLDLGEYKDLENLDLGNNKIISIKSLQSGKLRKLHLFANNLISVNFLNTIPNTKSLEYLSVAVNNIQPTDIAVFSKFVNLEILRIGTTHPRKKRNQFYGSFKSWKDLTKLEMICIDVTDVDSGLEYLPESLAKSPKKEGHERIECSPHNTNAKCSAIQDQIRPFNYDLGA